MSVAEYFRKLPDPRVRRTRRHALVDILVTRLCAANGGADDWVAIARVGRAKRTWFRGFLTLRFGIPSLDTFQRVCAALDPEAFKTAFLAWVPTVATLLPEEVIAVTGRVVTIDEMGCQTAIARAIQTKGGGCVRSLKSNQTRLHDDTRTFFVDAKAHAFQGISHTTAETVDGAHGRIEVRLACATDDLAWLVERRRWPGLRSVICVEASRTVGEHTPRDPALHLQPPAPRRAPGPRHPEPRGD
jgi:predicted transposase YbfD/YdcC